MQLSVNIFPGAAVFPRQFFCAVAPDKIMRDLSLNTQDVRPWNRSLTLNEVLSSPRDESSPQSSYSAVEYTSPKVLVCYHPLHISSPFATADNYLVVKNPGSYTCWLESHLRSSERVPSRLESMAWDASTPRSPYRNEMNFRTFSLPTTQEGTMFPLAFGSTKTRRSSLAMSRGA